MLKSQTKDENFLQTVGCGGFLLGRPPFPQCALSIARQAASCTLDSYAPTSVVEPKIFISAPGPQRRKSEFRLRLRIVL
jgi:hypothetical protein